MQKQCARAGAERAAADRGDTPGAMTSHLEATTAVIAERGGFQAVGDYQAWVGAAALDLGLGAISPKLGNSVANLANAAMRCFENRIRLTDVAEVAAALQDR